MVTIAITYFVRAALNRAICNELIDTKFDDFLKGLAGYFLNFKSLCNTLYITKEDSLLQSKSKSVHHMWRSNGRKSLKKVCYLLLCALTFLVVIVILYGCKIKCVNLLDMRK